MAPHRIFRLGSWLLLAALCAGVAPAAAERSLGNLHEGDNASPTSDGARTFLDAARAARDRGECPRAKFTVIVEKGDPLFQQALAQARRDALLALLGDRARQFLFEIDWEGAAHEVRVDYDAARDQQFPKLEVEWDPPSGTKVRPGTRIRARATATDDWNRWQSGIRRIDLDVLPESSNRSFGFHEWPPHRPPCESTPPPRTLEGAYTVPASPPPVVRLRARALDHAGHTSAHRRVAEYPTADWHGTFEMHNPNRGPQQTRTRAEIALNYGRDGRLTGTMVGEQELIAASRDHCSYRTARHNQFSIALTGSQSEGRSPEISVGDVNETKLAVQVLCDGTPPQQYETSILDYLPRALIGARSPVGEGEVAADGSRRYVLPPHAGEANVTIILRRVH